MSFRWLNTRTLCKGLLGLGILGTVTTSSLIADPPKEAERPAARPTTDPTVRLIQGMLEKLRKDLGPNDPAVVQLEQSLKLMTDKRPVDRPAAVPAEQPPAANPGLPRGDGDDFFDLAEELQQQMDMLRNAIQGRGGIQVQGGGLDVPLIIGPGGLQGLQRGGLGGPLMPGENLNARKGRFGIRIEVPTPALAAQLDLPNGQGLVCADVPAESVAGKAGLKPHDILLEVAGKPVPSIPAEFVNQLREVKADQAIDVVLLRKGRKETLRGIKLPEPAEQPALQPRLNNLPPLFPPAIQPPFPAAGVGEQIQVQQQNNAFTVQMNKDGVKLTLTGEKEDGQPVVGSVEIEANGKVIRAESIDKLPKEYQGMAEKAIKSVR